MPLGVTRFCLIEFLILLLCFSAVNPAKAQETDARDNPEAWYQANIFITDDSPETLLSIWELSQTGDISDEMHAELLDCLGSGDAGVVIMSAIALGATPAEDEEAYKFLRGLVEGNYLLAIEDAALYSLCRRMETGVRDAQVEARLLELLEYGDPYSPQVPFKILLDGSGPVYQEILDDHINKVTERIIENPLDRLFISDQLYIGEEVAPRLLETALNDESSARRRNAASVLCQIPRWSGYAKEHFRELLEDQATAGVAADGLGRERPGEDRDLLPWINRSLDRLAAAWAPEGGYPLTGESEESQPAEVESRDELQPLLAQVEAVLPYRPDLFGQPELFAAIVRCALSDSEQLRNTVKPWWAPGNLDGSGGYESREVLDILEPALNSDNPELVCRAADLLVRAWSQDPVIYGNTLVGLMQGGSPEVQRHVADSLKYFVLDAAQIELLSNPCSLHETAVFDQYLAAMYRSPHYMSDPAERDPEWRSALLCGIIADRETVLPVLCYHLDQFPEPGPALKVLELMLDHPDPCVRMAACSGVVYLLPESKVLLPKVVSLRKDEPLYLSHLFNRLSSENEELDWYLLELTGHESSEVRALAMRILGDLGVLRAQVKPRLVQGLQDESPTVRAAAAHALSNYGPDAADAAPLLGTLLLDEDEEVQRMAKLAMTDIGPAATPYFKDALRSDDDILRYNLMSSIRSCGGDMHPLLEELLPLNDQGSHGSRCTVAELMGRASRVDSRVVLTLIDYLDRDITSQRVATQSLAQLAWFAEYDPTKKKLSI